MSPMLAIACFSYGLVFALSFVRTMVRVHAANDRSCLFTKSDKRLNESHVRGPPVNFGGFLR